jgi:arginine decarboxylase
MADRAHTLRRVDTDPEPRTTPAPTDPAQRLRTDAPLLDAWLRYTTDVGLGALTPFNVPGHKQRTDLVGHVVRDDVPLYAGLAPIKQADALLAEAERRAAQLWGVDWCRFSVAGSTHGNQALALAVGEPGRPVVVSRTLHRSLLLGLVLAGLHPVWVRPEVDPVLGLPTSVKVDDVRRALSDHPDACAVMLGDPSYVGTIGDLPGHAAAAHAAGVPLIVDAAWAAHFGVHPDLPAHALAAGADAMVTSAHKLLPACNQAALVLARTTAGGGLLDGDRLERGFQATHTTSPSGTILASTDAARALLAADGARLGGRLVGLVAAARARLSGIPGLATLQGTLDDGTRVDPSKLVVLLAGTGAHGYAVEADLLAAGIHVEMADRDLLIPIVSLADDATSVGTLVDALIDSVQRHRGRPRPASSSAAWSTVPVVRMPPREAFFTRHEAVSADAAVGRVSAELVAPYPPGVPVLAPGEEITATALRELREARADGSRIAYAADPTLATLHVVAEPVVAEPVVADLAGRHSG